jgi:hypothetical protein
VKTEKVITAVLTASMLALLTPWMLMIEMGALHSHMPDVPAIGFWSAFWVCMVIGSVSAAFRGPQGIAGKESK